MALEPHIIKWIKNFLSFRSAVVVVGAEISESFEQRFGVPQGACLSPLLFSIFINDIPAMNDKNKYFTLMFAHDITLNIIFRKKELTEKQVNKHLQEMVNWLNKWRLKFAPHKCNYLMFQHGKSIEFISL